MRDKMESSLVVLPFSLGCVSHSSVAVGGYQPKKTKLESTTLGVTRKQEGDESSSVEEVNMKTIKSLSHISSGVHRLVKTIKSFSHLFVYKEEMDEERSEMEMEIGLPTDVKHVTHIGWDGTNTMVKPDSWENLSVTAPPEFLSFPNSVSLRQFEIAMATQVDAPLCLTASKFA